MRRSLRKPEVETFSSTHWVQRAALLACLGVRYGDVGQGRSSKLELLCLIGHKDGVACIPRRESVWFHARNFNNAGGALSNSNAGLLALEPRYSIHARILMFVCAM